MFREDMCTCISKLSCAKKKERKKNKHLPRFCLMQGGCLPVGCPLSFSVYSNVSLSPPNHSSTSDLIKKKKKKVTRNNGHVFITLCVCMCVCMAACTVLLSSSLVSWGCRHQCFCCPSQTSVPPLLDHWPTWSLLWSHQWCSEALVSEHRVQTTVSANMGKNIFSGILKTMLLDCVFHFKLIRSTWSFY